MEGGRRASHGAAMVGMELEKPRSLLEGWGEIRGEKQEGQRMQEMMVDEGECTNLTR